MWAWDASPQETSPQHPGVVRLHVHAFYFSTTARCVTSPTWGLPSPCNKALSLFCLYVQVWKRTTLSTLTEEDHSITLTYLQSSVPEHLFHAFYMSLSEVISIYRFQTQRHFHGNKSFSRPRLKSLLFKNTSFSEFRYGADLSLRIIFQSHEINSN